MPELNLETEFNHGGTARCRLAAAGGGMTTAMLDGNTAALRAYEREQERAEERRERWEHACAERAIDLMLTDFRSDTLAAVDEMLEERNADTDRKLQAAMAHGPEAFGAALMAATYAYRYQQAMEQARRELPIEDF